MKPLRLRRKLMSEINMVPFTDVVLVLLIIFMVTTPLILQGQVKVKLPKAGSSADTTLRPLTVTLTSANKVFVNDTQVPFKQLGRLLADELKKRRDKTVIINGDRGARHGNIVRILDIARESGAGRLAIATSLRQPGEKP